MYFALSVVRTMSGMRQPVILDGVSSSSSRSAVREPDVSRMPGISGRRSLMPLAQPIANTPKNKHKAHCQTRGTSAPNISGTRAFHPPPERGSLRVVMKNRAVIDRLPNRESISDLNNSLDGGEVLRGLNTPRSRDIRLRRLSPILAWALPCMIGL